MYEVAVALVLLMIILYGRKYVRTRSGHIYKVSHHRVRVNARHVRGVNDFAVSGER